MERTRGTVKQAPVSSLKSQLRKRTEENIQKGDDYGSFKTIWKPNLKEILGLTNDPFWKFPVPSKHTIDILPYIAGDLDPIHPNEWTYLLDIWIHVNIGVNKNSYICMAKSYNKPCVACDYRDELRSQENQDEKTIEDLKPRHRGIYNIQCYDNQTEEQKGTQIWDVATWFMEKYLRSLAEAPKSRGGTSTGGHIYFADIAEGKSIGFEVQGTKDAQSYVGHRFLDRDYSFEEEWVLQNTFQLDQLLYIPTQEEIQEALFGKEVGAVEEEKQPESPSRRQAPPVEKETVPSTGRVGRVGRVTTAETVTHECPVEGGIFGTSCETFEECEKCTMWTECAAEADAKQVQEAKNPVPETKPSTGGLPPRRSLSTGTTAGAPAGTAGTGRRGVVGRK